MNNAIIRNETGYDAEITDVHVVRTSAPIIAAEAHIRAVSQVYPNSAGALFQGREPVLCEFPGLDPGTGTFTSALLTGIVRVENAMQTTYQATLANVRFR